jgi:hypothetical protein
MSFAWVDDVLFFMVTEKLGFKFWDPLKTHISTIRFT